MRNLARFALSLTGALALAACAQTGAVTPEPVPTVGAVTQLGEHRTYTLKVRGMTCPYRCPAEVRDQLKVVRGVLRVEVDPDSRQAIVDVAPGTDPATLVEALHEPYSGVLM